MTKPKKKDELYDLMEIVENLNSVLKLKPPISLDLGSGSFVAEEMKDQLDNLRATTDEEIIKAQIKEISKDVYCTDDLNKDTWKYLESITGKKQTDFPEPAKDEENQEKEKKLDEVTPKSKKKSPKQKKETLATVDEKTVDMNDSAITIPEKTMRKSDSLQEDSQKSKVGKKKSSDKKDQKDKTKPAKENNKGIGVDSSQRKEVISERRSKQNYSRDGILDAIDEFLKKKCGVKKGFTREDVHEYLVKKFPNRRTGIENGKPVGMLCTVFAWINSRYNTHPRSIARNSGVRIWQEKRGGRFYAEEKKGTKE